MWAIVVAAGSGTRFGQGMPKQFLDLGGRPVVAWSVDAVRTVADHVVVVVPPGGLPAGVADPSLVGVELVTGAATRSGSVRCGLAAIAERAEGDDVVLVHDAARPLASPRLARRVVDAVCAGVDGAVPGVAVADTLKRVDADGLVLGTVDRNSVVAVQTPQAFRVGVLRRVHVGDPEATDDAALVEAAGGRVVVVDGEPANRKITIADDLAVVAGVVNPEDAP